MAGINFVWTTEDCEIAFCIALLNIRTVDERRARFSEIRGVSLAAIEGKVRNYQKLIAGESAPKKDTKNYQENFCHYDAQKCDQVLANFFYKNMGVVNEVSEATSRTSKKKREESLEEFASMFGGPEADTNYYEHCLELFKAGQSREAFEVLCDNVQEDCLESKVWNLFGMICGTLGDHKQAYGYFKKGFLIDSKDISCFMNYLTSCVAMSYTEEYFSSILKVFHLLEEGLQGSIIDNFYEGIKNGAIHLFSIPKEFYTLALYGHNPASVIFNLKDSFLFCSFSIPANVAAKTLPLKTEVIAQWLMAMGIAFDTQISNMSSDEIRQLISNAEFKSGTFDGGAEEMKQYFQSKKPILMNCYLLDFYLEQIDQRKENAA
jgi:tetratricopeptide (TPR) repeat protein